MSYPIVPVPTLRTLAGETRFQWGQQAVKQCLIRKFHYENRMASAEVDGFTPKVRYVGEKVEGSCNCEDSEGFEFCQHCVSIVLYANELSRQRRSLYKGPDKSKILGYLLSLDQKELARQCMELIESDPAVVKRYLLRVSLGAEQVDFKKLRSQITELTKHESNLFSLRQVQHFFSRIERFLEELSAADYLAQPDAMIKVVEYAIRRINLALERIRSRSNTHEASAAILRHLYRHLLEVLPSSAEAKATQLIKVWLEDSFHLLQSITEFVAHDPELGTAVQQKLDQVWRTADARTIPLSDWQADRLAAALLDAKAETSTLEQTQTWRTQLAKSPDDWLRVIDLWLEAQRPDAAMNLLLQQLRLHPEHTALHNALLKLHTQGMPSIEPIFELFCQHPIPMLDTLLRIAAQQQLKAEMAQRCIDYLQQDPSPKHHNMLMQLLLSLDETAANNTATPTTPIRPRLQQAVQLAQSVDLEPELVFSLVFRLLPQAPQLALPLFHKTLRHLLEAQRRKQDELAAEALYKLENMLPKALRLDHEDLLDQLRPLAQQRPIFQQHYRQMEQGAACGWMD